LSFPVRKITYLSALVLIFLVPWEDSISTLSVGSLARLMGFAVAGLWLATILVEGKFRKPHLFHILVLFFFLWNFLSLFWSLNVEVTLQRIKTYGQMLLLILIYWELFQRPEQLMAGLQAYIFGAYVLIGSTVYNFLSGNVAVEYEGRYSATGVNAVDLALFLMIGLPIAMQLVFAATHNRRGTILKLLNLCYIPLAIFAILLTGSRTSLIAVIPFGMFMVGAPQIKFDKKILIFALLLISLLILLPFIPTNIIERLGTIDDSIGAGDLGGRLDLWRQAVAVLAQHPILGVGGGAIDELIGSAVHNTFFSVAADTGVMGLILFLAMLGVVVYQILRLPQGTSGLWMAIFMTWVVGVLSLSWDFKKLTWLLLNFIIIEGSFCEQLKANIFLKRGSKDPHPSSEFLSDPKVT
jgi:O-antigen ligase